MYQLQLTPLNLKGAASPVKFQAPTLWKALAIAGEVWIQIQATYGENTTLQDDPSNPAAHIAVATINGIETPVMSIDLDKLPEEPTQQGDWAVSPT